MFTYEELDLLAEALNRTSRRHASEARFYPNRAKRHIAKARAMAELFDKIEKKKIKAA